MENQLIESLNQRVEHLRKWARRHNAVALCVLALAVVASVGATVCVSVNGLPDPVLMVVTIVPASAITLMQLFKFEEKARWYWKYEKEYLALVRELEYGGRTASDVVRALSHVERQMEQEWPSFGSVPHGALRGAAH